MSVDWFELPAEPFFNNRTENSIRAWQPGDGLICSAGNRGRSPIRCTSPVAVMRTKGRGTDPDWRTYVLCSLHVTGVIRDLTRDSHRQIGLKTAAQKAAQEQVIAAHWDEYQDAIAAFIAAEKAAMLSKLPAGLRDLIHAADIEGDES